MGKQRAVILLLILVLSGSFASANAPDDTLKGKATNKFLLFPFFLKSPETKWGFGTVAVYFFKANKKDTTIRTSDVNLVTLYTLRMQIVGVMGATIFFPEEKNIFRFQASYSYYPDKSWGIGNNTNEESEEEYSIKQFYFNPQLLRRIYRDWYAGMTYEFQNIHDFVYVPGGVFDRHHITGRHGGNVSGVGVLLSYDTRDNAYSPSKGFYSELNATAYDKNFGSGFDFTTFTLDLRRFISLSAHTSRVLALQVIVKNNAGDVPLRNLSLLGGPEMMRGYYKGRFMDMDLVAFQAELRQHLFWRLGMTAFGGMGEVGPRLVDLRPAGLHYAWGAGLRIMVNKNEKLNLRVDYGFGENSKGLYVILKEAF